MSGDGAALARELIRGLIDEILIVPAHVTQRIELRGELAVTFGLAGLQTAEAPAGMERVLDMAEQVKVVAGTGFEPVAFRL